MGTDLLIAAEEMLRGSSNPEALLCGQATDLEFSTPSCLQRLMDCSTEIVMACSASPRMATSPAALG